MARRDPAEVVLDELRPALEEVVAFARRLAEAEGTAAVPPTLRPLLKLQRLSTGSLRAARSAVDADDELRAAVAEQAQPADPERLAWMWLARSPGWDELLESVLMAATAEDRATEREQAERSAQRRLQQLEAKQRRTAEALAEAQQDAARLRQRLTEASRAGVQDRAELSELRATAARQQDELSRNAVRAQQAEEKLGAQRAERRALQAELAGVRSELSDLRTELDRHRAPATARQAPQDRAAPIPDGATPVGSRPEATGGPAAGTDLEALRSAVGRAAEILGLLGAADSATPPPSGPRGGAASGDPANVPTRRRPLRAGRGLRSDTPQGLLDLLTRPGVVVLVDGYNVAKLRWPHLAVDLQRQRLVAALEELANRTATGFDVIFDGADLTVWRQARPGSGLVRVSFTAEGQEADDDIIARVTGLEADRGVIVVTNDRRVQDGVARLGATVVASDLLCRLFA